VRLIFDPGDDDTYNDARDVLLDELDGWLDLPAPDRAGVVTDTKIFLDWRYKESSGVLDDFTPADVAEFLLEWCPHRFKGHPSGAEFLCRGVGIYVSFMAATGRLVGGAERAGRLSQLAIDLVPTVREEIRDPTPALDLYDSYEERNEALQAAIDEIPEKYGRGSVQTPQQYELPFVYIAPPHADVEAVAAAVPFLAKLDVLRDYLGPDGKQLTDKGNVKLADGRALIDLLDTGDEMDPQIGDKTWRTASTANLPRLNLILDLAKRIGAVRVHQCRLVPVKVWDTRSPLQRGVALFQAIVELGPLELLSSGRFWLLDEMAQVLDDGIVHWLAPLLGPENELPLDTIVEWAQSVVDRKLSQHWPDHRDLLEKFTKRDVSAIFEVLEEAALVRWTDRLEVTEQFGRGYWTGGNVALTALGRHVLPDYLDEAGYVLRGADDVADGDGSALIEALLAVAETQQDAVLVGWQPDRPALERARMLTEAIVASSSAASRMMGFVALQKFDIEVAEPLVRELLDTAVAGHAALWLIQQDRADHETVGNFVDVAVLVDVFSAVAQSPEELCSLFAGMPEPLSLLERMWRHPAPEAELVLDALGQHLPDKSLAKAARKAAIRRRSWLASRRD
jgi:hypothetical protein